jgi:hypothetical protein
MRSSLRFASVIGVATLSMTAVAPAIAAAPLAQAGANAVTVSVAGNAHGSGDVTATNDGSGEQKTGDAAPPISVLQGQQLIKAGVLAQEAAAQVDDGAGRSVACAGITGNGGSVVKIGDSHCLNPGNPLGLSLTNLDLSDTLVVDPESALGQLAAANAPLQAVLSQITGPLADAVAATPLGTTGLGGTLGVIEGSCTSGPGTASGEANIVDTELTLDIAGQKVVLAKLPAKPAPNTEVPVNLDAATGVILGAVKTQLETMLAAPGGTGPLAPLGALPDALQDQVVTAIVDATREQLLTPLAENVLNIVLNRQVRTGDDAIKVRAFDLTVLPAATEQLGADLVNLQIGNAACGPAGRAAAAAPPAAEAAAPTALPTAVSAGAASMPGQHAHQGDSSANAIVLGAFALLVASAAGFVTLRRLRG